jgi:hypothetical protein
MGENLRQILEFCILWFLFAMLVFICVQVVQTNNNETMNPLEEKRKKQPLSIENKHKICNLTKIKITKLRNLVDKLHKKLKLNVDCDIM